MHPIHLRMFLLIPVILIVYDVDAQGGFRIGVKGGYGYTILYNQNQIDDKDIGIEPSFGWNIGLSTGWNMPNYNYGFTLGYFLKQYQHGTKFKSIEPSPRSKVDLMYFELPALLRFRPKGNKMTRSFTLGGPYFEIGLQPGFLLNANDTRTDSTGTSKSDIKDEYKGFNLAGVIGVGAHQVGVRQWAVTHGLRFVFGITDIISSNGKNGQVYPTYRPTRTFSVTYILAFSYKFPYR